MHAVRTEIGNYSAELGKWRSYLHHPCTEKEDDRTEIQSADTETVSTVQKHMLPLLGLKKN